MIFIVALLAQAAWAQTADLIVENANVYTVSEARPKARAIAVKGTRILAVGDDLGRHAGAATRRIDAKGGTVIPGFIDCHVHMAGLGDSIEILDLRAAKSSAEVAATVAEAAKSRPKGEWIRGRAWDQTRWPGAQFPNAAELSRAAKDHPVYLARVDGHAAWVNEKALELADVNAATQDPPGGRIHRDAAGKPTGILIDRAMGLVSRRIPATTAEQTKRQILRASQECARLGLTTVHDAGVSAAHIAAYRELIASGQLLTRVYAMIGGPGQHWESWLQKGPEVGDWLTVRSIKLVADGALGSRGAAMKQPYSDEPSNRGLLILKQEEIARVARQAVERGFQVNTHAIGDLANRATLDAYAEALGGPNDRRFRVEHAQIVSLEDIPLFQRFGIVASIQATHATSDMRWAEQRVGPKRVLGAYPWQRFLKAGVRIANGSDFPVEEPNPLLGFYASVTRQDAQGEPKGGWMPDQVLSRQKALESWTRDGAYAAFEEHAKGTLEPNKLADFLVLSKDIVQVPAAEIPRTRVLMTVTGGRIVHTALP
ncbi:MAG: amidohydrolase [Bryobacterales bacterium]|nr:amidohydrolase [Bryobacterales bacterium]